MRWPATWAAVKPLPRIKDDKDNSFTGDATVTAGSITVEAKDNAELYSNVQFASNSVSVSDGGAGLLVIHRQVAYANYTDKTTSVQLENGDRVRITDTNDDNYGNVMIFLGQDGVIPPAEGSNVASIGSADLTNVDFGNLDYWVPSLETQVVPQGLNISPSDSLAVGAIIVRNDLIGNYRLC